MRACASVGRRIDSLLHSSVLARWIAQARLCAMVRGHWISLNSCGSKGDTQSHSEVQVSVHHNLLGGGYDGGVYGAYGGSWHHSGHQGCWRQRIRILCGVLASTLRPMRTLEVPSNSSLP